MPRSTLLSASSAAFLLDLVNAQQLTIGAPDFDEAVERVIRARQELKAIIAQDAPTRPDAPPGG